MSNITTTFQLVGLHCQSCQKISEKRIQKIEGVSHASTNVETGALMINSNRIITKEEIVKALEGTDYKVN